MKRIVLALLVVASTVVARADTAPTFAVQFRSWDAIADKMTFGLADELRKAGSKKTAAYRAKGTHADFVAANTEACITTEPACAAQIGAALGVDYVFVGTVETRGKRFVATINVIAVKTKKRVRSVRELVARSTPARTWARTIYSRLVDDETGELAISCNAPRAVVLVDGQKVTELFESRATLTGLSLGVHAIELRAPGFKPYTDDVAIDGVTKLSVLLEAAP